METVQITAASIQTLLTRVSVMEAQRGIETPITLPVSAWDAIQRRVAALEDNLLAADNQPHAADLAEATLEAEFLAWCRVNGRQGLTGEPSTMAAWTAHFAHSRHLGQGVA